MESCLGNNKIVLTIDLGHCETVVSCNDYNRSYQDALWQIYMKTAVSIIWQEGKETVCVGDSAVNNQSIAKSSQIYFRKSPSEMSAEEIYCFKRFLQGVYFYVLEKYPELNTKAHSVCLLLPSYGKNWDKDNDIYLDILSEARLPNCGIVYKKYFSHIEERSSSFVSIVIGEEETYAVCYLQNRDNFLLNILPYQYVIKSAVSIIEQEGQQTVCIGEKALFWSKEVLSSFKTRPSLMNESERKLLRAFIKKVYENILKHPVVQENVKDVQLVVPSLLCGNSHDFEEYRLICSEVKIPLMNIVPNAFFLFKRALCFPGSPMMHSCGNGTIIVEINKDNIAISRISKDTEVLESTSRFNAFNADSYRLQDTNVYLLKGKTVLKCLLKYLIKHPSDESMAHLFERFEKYGHIPSYHLFKMHIEHALYDFLERKTPNFFTYVFDYRILTSSDSEYVETPISGFGSISIERTELCKILQDYYAAVQQSVDEYVRFRNISPPYVILGGFYRDDDISRCLEETCSRAIIYDYDNKYIY